MPRWQNVLLAALSGAAIVTACAPSTENGSLFLSDTPISMVRTPTPRPPATPALIRTPGLVKAQQTTVARGGTGVNHTTDPSGLPVLVFLDPGHGGVDWGTKGTDADGQTVAEKNVTLAVARQAALDLRADGIGVSLSRDDDSLPGLQPSDYTPDGNLLTPEGVLHDLQGRVDRANASGAVVFLSIHMNAYSDPAIGGSETFYDSARPFADENQRFATLVQNHIVTDLRTHNVPISDRGVSDDTTLQAEGFGTLGASYNHLIVLGPPVPGRLRASQMPGALSEPLFLSNPVEAANADQSDVQAVLARAYVDAIEEFLRS